MQEIKFRAWDGQNNEMDAVVEMLIDQYGGMDVRNSRRMGINATALGPASLMQYTGLKDKNGREIYEGDIVEMSRTITDREGRKPIREVMNWVGGVILPWPHDQEFEVIGNIYENAELLTPSKAKSPSTSPPPTH